MSILGGFHGTYDPAKVIITIGDSIVHGFIPGDYVVAKYDEDRFFKIKGTDGEVGRARNLSRAGTISIKLMATSGANDELSKMQIIYFTGAENPPFPISIRDLSGKTNAISTKSWVKTPPDLVFGMEVGEWEWVFDCADLAIVYGGVKDNSLAGMIGF